MKGTNSTRTVVLTVLLAALVLAVADLFVMVISILLLVFAGVLFGVFLNGPSRWISSVTTLSYNWANGLVLILLLAMAAAGFYFMGSAAVEQAASLQSQLDDSLRKALDRLEEFEWAEQYLSEGGSGLAETVLDREMLQNVLQGVTWLSWLVGGSLVIFFVGLYVAFDPDLYEQGIVKLVPPDKRSHAEEVLRKLRTVLGYWVVGRLISMSIVAVLTMIALWLLDVPMPVSLGILAGLLSFIPNIGPVLAALPQALLALQVDSSTVLYVILFNVGLQTFESYLITPMVERYEVALPPALTIVAQLLMGVCFGLIGVVMAAPLTAATILLIQELYIRGHLGDSEQESLA